MGQRQTLAERVRCIGVWQAWERALANGDLAPDSLAALGPQLAQDQSGSAFWLSAVQFEVEASGADMTSAQAAQMDRAIATARSTMQKEIRGGNRGKTTNARQAISFLAQCAQ